MPKHLILCLLVLSCGNNEGNNPSPTPPPPPELVLGAKDKPQENLEDFRILQPNTPTPDHEGDPPENLETKNDSTDCGDNDSPPPPTPPQPKAGTSKVYDLDNSYSAQDILQSAWKVTERHQRLMRLQEIPTSKVLEVSTWVEGGDIWASLIYVAAGEAPEEILLACHFHGQDLACHKKKERL